jgi:hypothetical protein
MKGIATALAMGTILAQSGPAGGADVPVDLELVLAVDVSGSMDIEERELQRAGYMAALVHPAVLHAIAMGPLGRIALTLVEWAGGDVQSVAVPWQLVDGAESAAAFVAALAAAPMQRQRGTSISGALLFSAELFADSGFEGLRKVIDVSGDGPNNSGPPVLPARDAVLARGIEINGLPIMLRASVGSGGISDLDVYYEDCVIGGPGAFVVPVRDLDHMAEAVRRKLVLEIAGGPSEVVPAQMRTEPRIDCMIGEQLRRQWEGGG